ncbi:MAG TPA: hypothetical protein P5307_29370, partial [Pirellulaceae bacterium]|nr:hypothetical protein [Pirellulaceae bacterium]
MNSLRLSILSIVLTQMAVQDVRPEDRPSTDDWLRVDDIRYAEVDGHPLLLDLYLPKNVNRPPVVVWIHGGAW